MLHLISSLFCFICYFINMNGIYIYCSVIRRLLILIIMKLNSLSHINIHHILFYFLIQFFSVLFVISYFINMNIFHGIYLLLCISLLLNNCSWYFVNQLHTSSFIHLYTVCCFSSP